MKHLLFIILLITTLPLHAQIALNNPLDMGDTAGRSAVKFMKRYLTDLAPGHRVNYADYWPAEDCRTSRFPDPLLFALEPDIPLYALGWPTILYAKPEGGMTHIKLMMSRVDSSGKLTVISISNHYVRREEGGVLHFISPLRVHSDQWQTSTMGDVTWYYPQNHNFNRKLAETLLRNIKLLREEWDLPALKIKYYFADTKEELDHMKGIDFTIAQGVDKPSGSSDGNTNTIYCGGLGENYFHEAVHLYLNRLFQGTALPEGLAVMYGGSLGKPLAWHIARLDTVLKRYPDIDLTRPENFYYLDQYTNPYAVIQGLLCAMAYEKGGLPELQKTMNYTTLDELLEKEYKLKLEERNAFLRKKISEYAERKD